MRRVKSMNRSTLLKALATEVGGRDFALEVMELSEPGMNKRKACETDFDDLAEVLLGEMDPAEKAEFKEMQESLAKRQKKEVQDRWQKWRKEARELCLV